MLPTPPWIYGCTAFVRLDSTKSLPVTTSSTARISVLTSLIVDILHMPRFKLVFFSPVKSTPTILNHLFTKYPQNVGKIGEYEQCAFMTTGKGQFKPSSNANPAIGTKGELEYVEEHRVEVVVNDDGDNVHIRSAIAELKKVRNGIP